MGYNEMYEDFGSGKFSSSMNMCSACHICNCDMEVSSCGPYLCKSCECTGVKCPI